MLSAFFCGRYFLSSRGRPTSCNRRNNSVRTRLNSLLPEILPIIFGNLSLEDRKNVRLTCRSFKDACDRVYIGKRNEKYVFHFGYFGNKVDAYSSADFILNCEQLRSEVEFRAVDLRQLRLSVWRKLGDQITSLVIDHCHVNDEIFEEICFRCPRLVNLYLDAAEDVELFATEPNVLDWLITLGIERPKLRTLKLFTRQPLSDSTSQKIFKIFPNIRTFGRGRCYQSAFSKVWYNDRNDYDRRPISMSIELPRSVENFVYSTKADSLWMVPYSDCSSPKFKELEFTLAFEKDEALINVERFFSRQTELEIIDLRISRWVSSSAVKCILFHVLRQSPKLRALTFRSKRAISFSELEFTEFLTAIRNLELLDLKFKGWSLYEPDRVPLLQLPAMDYPRLKYLRLYFESTRVSLLESEIISRCRSLHSLHLESVNEDLLKSIIRDHTELRRLSFNCIGLPHKEPSWERHFTARFEKLEYLYVRYSSVSSIVRIISAQMMSPWSWSWSWPPRAPIVLKLLSKLDCPNLKLFRCEYLKEVRARQCFNEEDTIEILRILSQRSPLLETLIISSTANMDVYKVHCENLKKLRYLVRNDLSAYDAPEITDDAFMQVFNACPSLKYVVSARGYGACKVLFYNRKTRSLVSHLHNECRKQVGEILDLPSYERWKI